jgi:hypothetical protein
MISSSWSQVSHPKLPFPVDACHNLHVSLKKWHLSLVQRLYENRHCLLLAGVPVHCTAVYKNSSTKMSLPYHGILKQHYVLAQCPSSLWLKVFYITSPYRKGRLPLGSVGTFALRSSASIRWQEVVVPLSYFLWVILPANWNGRTQGLYKSWIGPLVAQPLPFVACVPEWKTVGGNGQVDLWATHQWWANTLT